MKNLENWIVSPVNAKRVVPHLLGQKSFVFLKYPSRGVDIFA
jgi:hypothetical protein